MLSFLKVLSSIEVNIEKTGDFLTWFYRWESAELLEAAEVNDVPGEFKITSLSFQFKIFVSLYEDVLLTIKH